MLEGVMVINSDQIKSRLSPILQRLMDDVLAKSDGSRPLEFGDAQEYEKIIGKPFMGDAVACLIPSNKRFVIIVRNFDSITVEEELEITHELGHLWLTFHRFPRERSYNLPTEQERQERYDICFGPLLDVMEHGIFYPWLKTIYNIDLYKPGNQRLVGFLRNDLPNRKIQSEGDEISLIMNYIKFKVESNNHYWHERLQKAYSKAGFENLREVGERLLPIIEELVGVPPNPLYFTAKYRDALRTMNIKQEIWPSFALQMI